MIHSPDVSVCVVTRNACDLLRDCLYSLLETARGVNFEIILVDNASTDETVNMIQREFPQVILKVNDHNKGFALPMNQALKQVQGKYLLLINPDAIFLENAIQELLVFMETHPEAGICGPKVLNKDGSLQKSCRRGIARPWNTFTYFSGLAGLFPNNKLLGGYHLGYLDENSTQVVDGVSGSCMLIRRAVVDEIGYLDERYFAYQEDSDYCLKAQLAGWKIYYVPASKIIHYGGQGGSHVQPYRSLFEWHRSYFLFYRKNLAQDYFFLFNWLYYLAMFCKFILTAIANLFRVNKFPNSRRR